MILTLAIIFIGGIVFFPLLKMAALTKSSKVKNVIFLILVVVVLLTLKSCSDSAQSTLKDNNKGKVLTNK